MNGDSNSKIRRINGILSAILIVFFFMHAVLGCAVGLWDISNTLEMLVWAGVALLVAHIIGSVASTWYMYTDQERPPSVRKKRHQVLKWATGIVLLIFALYHMIFSGGSAAMRETAQLVILLLLTAAIAVHGYTGIKSLTRDLHISKQARVPIRVALIASAVAVGLFACFAAGVLG